MIYLEFVMLGFICGGLLSMCIVFRDAKKDHEWYIKMVDDYARHFDNLLLMRSDNKHRGSDFDELLKEESMLDDCENVAAMRVDEMRKHEN